MPMSRLVRLASRLTGVVAALAMSFVAFTSFAADSLTPAEARAIAAEAYIYGYPLVDNYRINHAYWVDKSSPEYRGPINALKHTARVYGPEDKAVQTPNSDTPYSFAWLDLRSEPLVLTLPAIEANRYYSVQLVDSYTYNFDYLGTRTSGNKGGKFLIVGPDWKGQTPAGFDRVIRAETTFVLAIIRTQLFSPDDMSNVIKIQAGYKLEPLSASLGQAAPTAAPAIDFIRPLTPDAQKKSLDFFGVLNFALQFCPPLAEEQEVLARFAKIGVGAGKKFDAAALSPEMREALEGGIQDAWKKFDAFQKEVDAGTYSSGDVFGTRAKLKGNYLFRLAGAVIGIYGNSKQEAMYPIYFVDANGKPLNAAKGKYRLHFAKDELPPVGAFWSLTMYGLPDRLLVANPLNRYLLNSPMLPHFKRDADGGVTLYVQHESPGKDLESNWLPAPPGPFFAVLRLYLPEEAALTGRWKQPPLTP